MKNYFILSILNLGLVLLFQTESFAQQFNIKDYGAIADGKTMNTRAIQSAINACHDAGGGTVFFPDGTYISGSIEMLSNITLNFEAGATLKGSPNMVDYKSFGRTSEERNTALISGVNLTNISFTGQGAIDGNDSAFFDWDKIHPDCCFDPQFTRQGGQFENSFPDGPSEVKSIGRPGILIALIECENIRMSGITIKNSPNWSVHLACCKYVHVTGVNFFNSLLVPNADAIDISNCQNVNISDCVMIAGDDGIAISPCADGFCQTETENINVSNCTITCRSSGIRIGWAQKNIRNCTFQNLVIYSNRGIGIFVKHTETIENLLFNNIIIHTRLHSGWWGIGEPIHISQIPLGTWYGKEQNSKEYGIIKNVKFSNINIESENGIVLYGFNKNSIQDISFQHISHYFKNSPLNNSRGGNFELRPAFDNKYSLFKHDIPAFFAKNTKNLVITDYTLSCDKNIPEFCTNAIYCEAFSELKIDGFKGCKLSHKPDVSVIQLVNGEKASLLNCTSTDKTDIFLNLKNVSENGFFMNNDLRNVKSMIVPENNSFKYINNLK